VVNLSLGGEGDSQLLSGLIQAARQQGVLFFGAAGNQPTTDPTFPAAYPEVIAVTAGDKMGNIAPYANRGSFVDVIGPGVSLVDFQGQSYLVRGTSAATAYVSGAAAGFRASGSAPQDVEIHIRKTLGPKPVQTVTLTPTAAASHAPRRTALGDDNFLISTVTLAGLNSPRIIDATSRPTFRSASFPPHQTR